MAQILAILWVAPLWEVERLGDCLWQTTLRNLETRESFRYRDEIVLRPMNHETHYQGINFGRFAFSNFTRRSSVYGKQSIGAGGAASAQSSSIGKDPRPVREKSFQLNCIKNLIGFLTRSGYDKPISQKILTAPSTKDFQLIFKFLYHQLDPSYEFGKKFEEEVPGLLRGIRYPYCNDISKSSLLAVGSIHAWPSLLAMLNWMVELILCCDELANNVNGQDASNRMQDVENTVNGLDNFTVEARPDRIFYDYLCKSYKVFLAGNDDFDGMIHELGKNFGKFVLMFICIYRL